MSGLVTPAELEKIAEEKEAAKIREALERKREAEEEERKAREEFMSREPGPEALERFNAMVLRAAGAGLTELEVMRFPAAWCTDGGRAINNDEQNWPETLQGWAKSAYDYFEPRLREAGFKIRAQIVSYPDGTLGDVGIFVSW